METQEQLGVIHHLDQSSHPAAAVERAAQAQELLSADLGLLKEARVGRRQATAALEPQDRRLQRNLQQATAARAVAVAGELHLTTHNLMALAEGDHCRWDSQAEH
jgi:hypothetical protein